MEISQKIIDYAIWYYLRYYPSRKKLSQKLIEKFGPDSEKGKRYGGINFEEIEYILTEKLRNVIQEYEVCRAKIVSLKSRNKNVRYIQQNLNQKGFEREMINKILEDEYLVSEKTILGEEKLRKKILQFQKKGKSILAVKQTLIERPQDHELVGKLIDEVYAGDETEGIKKEFQKLRAKNVEKQKIIQRLMAKGFRYDDIKLLFK